MPGDIGPVGGRGLPGYGGAKGQSGLPGNMGERGYPGRNGPKGTSTILISKADAQVTFFSNFRHAGRRGFSWLVSCDVATNVESY